MALFYETCRRVEKTVLLKELSVCCQNIRTCDAEVIGSDRRSRALEGECVGGSEWGRREELGELVKQASGQANRVMGGDFLNQTKANVSGSEAARDVRRANVRLTDNRSQEPGASHWQLSYTTNCPAPLFLSCIAGSQVDGITMHSMALLNTP